MSALKSIMFPAITFVWLAAALTYPLYSDMLQQPVASVSSQSVTAVSVDQPTEEARDAIVTGKPRHISIPSVDVNIGIDDGFYDFDAKNWTITEEAAFFATVTTPINTDSGSTFIYGHNSKKVFGNLLKLDQPVEAVVTTDNGYTFVYEYRDRQTVSPTDTSVLTYEGAPRIMLQTCTGLWNENREMFYFYLKDYQAVS